MSAPSNKGFHQTGRERRRRFLVGDSIWCGGTACALLLLMDSVAAMKGGRAEVPAGVVWTAVAGMLLPFLNLYFIGRDLLAGLKRDAAIGLVLSILALVMAFDPPWKRFVILAENMNVVRSRPT